MAMKIEVLKTVGAKHSQAEKVFFEAKLPGCTIGEGVVTHMCGMDPAAELATLQGKLDAVGWGKNHDALLAGEDRMVLDVQHTDVSCMLITPEEKEWFEGELTNARITGSMIAADHSDLADLTAALVTKGWDTRFTITRLTQEP